MNTDQLQVTPVSDVLDGAPENVAFLSRKYGNRLRAMVTSNEGDAPKFVGGAESVLLQGRSDDQIFKVQRADATREDLEKQRQRWATLQEHFGDSAHCIIPRHHWWHVVSQESPDGPEHSKGFLVHQQEIIPEVQKGYHLRVQATYPERYVDPNSPEYASMNQRYVALQDSECPSLLSHPDDGLQHVLQHADSLPAVRESLIDFVRRGICFCQETGEVLDFAGGDNFSVVWRDNAAKIVLIDPLYPKPEAFQDFADAAHMYYTHDICRKPTASSLKNGMLCLRTLNSLADQLGIPDRLDPTAIKGQDLDRLRHELTRMPWPMLCQRIQVHN